MVAVPSWIPLAALATFLLPPVSASWIARRQESGKLRAGAEADLRVLVVELRADMVHARQELDRNSTYVADAFTAQHLVDFTAKAVAFARHLLPRRQRPIVAALTVLVGRWRIGLAEDIGPTWLRSREALPAEAIPARAVMNAQTLEFVMADHRRRALEVDEDDGLLGKMRTAQLPDVDHEPALAAVDRLLTAVSGNHRFGQPRWRTLLRRTPLSESR
ncbi:hypothetical protein AB0904_07005 [Streptomyces sp. NPDC006684]|uniref:hypothetical protein n=1 Tax=Streptomyces sp. NPDC006684 TaxID=3154477 RepID=UPI0034524821